MPALDSRGRWLRLRVAIFFLVLFVPLAVMLIPPLRPWTDSRAAVFPDWSWRVGAIKRYPSQFQEQFNAALPFRVKVAALSRDLYLEWLGISPVTEAIVGTDGWLYYTGPASEKILDRHVRGRDPLSQAELELLRRTLVERTRHFRNIGAKYVLAIAPNKESIYPEYLPAWVGPKVGPSRLDQLMADLKSVPEVTVIDLRPGLIADKNAAPLYFKTDTHWKSRGAYAAYREIIRVLEPEFPALAARSWASFKPSPVERQGTDIARMIGLEGAPAEADFELTHSTCAERRPVPVPIPDALLSKLTNPGYSTRCAAPGNVDAVIFHDSFGVAVAGLLEESFRSTVNFSATAGRNDVVGYGMPEQLKANLVLEIMVERSLNAGPPF